MARRAFRATEDIRKKVRSLAARGVRHEDIAEILDCDAKTLRKHFREELDRGMAEANSNVTGALYEKAVSGDTIAQMFWVKARLGWREKDPEKPIPASQGPADRQCNRPARQQPRPGTDGGATESTR